MSFTPEMLQTRLSNANETADSITSTAQWILFHKRQAAVIAQEWAEFLRNQPNKLKPIYIANEVIQQSKMKRGGEFVTAFVPVMPSSLAAAYAESDGPTKDRILRVIKVWRDRSIFPSADQDAIEHAVNSGSANVPADIAPLAAMWTAFVAKPSLSEGAKITAELERLKAKVSQLTDTLPKPYTVADAVSGEDAMDISDGEVGYAE